MTFTAVKEKLHEYIDHADEKKVQAIFTLVENEIGEEGYRYDEETLRMLRATSDDYFSGKMKGYPVEESMKRIRKQIRKA